MSETLSSVFQSVGKGYGYDSVSAEATEFKDFKIKWRRSCGWVEFEVSDYLKDAPPEVVKGLAEMIFSRISGTRMDEYPKEMHDWITSDEFVKSKQKIFLSRSKNLTRSAVGEHIDLNESYKRLVNMGLVTHDKDVVISWTKRPNVKSIGHASVLMKVITISSALDSDEIPPFVCDFVLYHELLHLKKGFDPFGERHGTDFRAMESLFPKADEADQWLKRLRLVL